MDSPVNSSSTSTSSSSSSTNSFLCEICGQKAIGRHYGATACRACAAFFRRTKEKLINIKKCTKGTKCEFFKKGFFTCKYCRLQRCIQMGMTSDCFQFDRDKLSSIERNDQVKKIIVQRRIPSSMSNFIGRPDFIIFSTPNTSSGIPKKNVIDVHNLLEQALIVLRQGIETPLIYKSPLKKMAVGLRNVRESSKIQDPRNIVKYGKDETLAQWERDILKMTKWLTYFDDFQKLPEDLQIAMVQGIWSVWRRIEILAIKAIEIRRIYHEDEIRKFKTNEKLYDWKQMQIDMSWCSTRSVEELKFFVEIDTDIRLDEMTRSMIELNPTDEEFSFMMAQLCFHYVGKRFQGKILEVTEKMQQVLADDLHIYYVKEEKRPNYASRLASMMKINNQLQEKMIHNRTKTELAVLFDIFHIEFSHPLMFENV